MTAQEVSRLPITALSALLASGELTSTALTQMALARAVDVGRGLNCVIALLETSALAAAAAADRRAAAGERRGPLDGVPIGLKDNFDVAGVPTTAGFGGSPAPAAEDAEAVRRLRAAGAIIIAKLNMQEGALGSSGENAHHGRVINPQRAGYSPGGSSSGSGAAVAAGICAAALGTDTGGSVRIPAAWCGLVGLKASYGLISTRGVVPLSYSLDHVGPLTRSVGDAAVMLATLQGVDPRCTESRRRKGLAGFAGDGKRLDGLRIGVLRGFEQEAAEPAVAAAFQATLDTLRQLGAELHDAEMPGYDLVAGRRAGFLRVEVEAAHVHRAAFEAAPERFSPEMRGFIEYGLSASAQQLMRADRRIAAAGFALSRCLEQADLLVSPTTPQTANAYGEPAPENAGTYTMPANFARCPAITLPMGRDDKGLPIGLQVLAPVDAEAALMSAAATIEAALGQDMRPPADAVG